MSTREDGVTYETRGDHGQTGWVPAFGPERDVLELLTEYVWPEAECTHGPCQKACRDVAVELQGLGEAANAVVTVLRERGWLR